MEEYYYIDAAGLQQGPVPADRLVALGVGRKTPVWKAGMADWATAENVPELASLFAGEPPVFTKEEQRAYESAPAKPNSYLIWAILSTICCCLPLGIVSIVYAARVNDLYLRGNYEEASASSRKALNWALASLVVSVVGTIIYFIYFALAFPTVMDELYVSY